MTDPSEPRPVPGPPRSGPGASTGPVPEQTPGAVRHDPFADLDERPVSEHVAVYEAEHARLERELGTIDQL
jgi:hypothetical protein